ncbi:BRO-N domain-containing protein [Moraxella bovis]|uniref:BRO-N domain-containing protein n=1 Tax=Moraxella bovis TaxID=476 RepID=UPI000DC7CF2B|nr:BRO family protein [Moraxella bovis]AWY19953.1 hypothetical protein DQF64_05225 [Moraxella bovis]UYZ94447.1 hypothetical protein LP121_11285 [Moraxella bovis]
MKTLTFQNITLTPVKTDNQIWLTSAELAKALGYAETDSVTKIYNRNSDEFTGNMTTTVKMTVVRKTGKVEMDNRIFSLRGCHLIAMFARTAVAKEFRKWVLDILDSVVGKTDRLSTTADRKGLVQAVNRLSDMQGMTYSTTWKLVHDYMNVESVDELTVSQIPVAVAYVHSMMMADNKSNLNTPFVQNIIADTAHQNRMAQDELGQMMAHFGKALDHIAELQNRLKRQEVLIDGAKRQLVA